MRKLLGALLLSVTVLWGAGCASLSGYAEEPKVSLQEVYPRDISFSGATLVFVVNVENPNGKEIKLKEVAYKVFVSGQELTEAKTEKEVLVPAKGSANVELPLPVQYSRILTKLSDIVVARELSYRIEGSAKMSFFRIPFSKEGKVELR